MNEFHTPGEEAVKPQNFIDVSFVTTLKIFALLKQAGEIVGLQVDQPTIVFNKSGRETPMQEGSVGVRYTTEDADLLIKFHAKVTELRAAAQQTSSTQG
jgi:hypothetical protein